MRNRLSILLAKLDIEQSQCERCRLFCICSTFIRYCERHCILYQKLCASILQFGKVKANHTGHVFPYGSRLYQQLLGQSSHRKNSQQIHERCQRDGQQLGTVNALSHDHLLQLYPRLYRSDDSIISAHALILGILLFTVFQNPEEVHEPVPRGNKTQVHLFFSSDPSILRRDARCDYYQSVRQTRPLLACLPQDYRRVPEELYHNRCADALVRPPPVHSVTDHLGSFHPTQHLRCQDWTWTVRHVDEVSYRGDDGHQRAPGHNIEPREQDDILREVHILR